MSAEVRGHAIRWMSCAALLVIGACGKDSGAEPPVRPPVLPSGNVAPTPSPSPARSVTTAPGLPIVGVPTSAALEAVIDKGLLLKLYRYHSQCVESLSMSAFRARDRYHEWVDPAQGPGPSASVDGVPAIPAGDLCSQAIGEAAREEPPLPAVERAALAYIEAYGRLEPIVERAHFYYERRNHLDDDFAQGREMHALLEAELRSFVVAHEAFATALESERAALLGRMARRADPDRDPKGWLGMRLVIEGERLAKESDALTLSSSLGAHAAALTAYESLVDDARRFPAVAALSQNETVRWDPLASAASSLLAGMKDRMRRIRDAQASPRAPRPPSCPASGCGGAHAARRVYYAFVQMTHDF